MIEIKKHITCLVCALIFPVYFGLYAQSDSVLTLKDCLKKSFDQNSGFMSIKNLEIIREQNRKILRTALFPQVSLSSNINQFVQNSTVIFTGNILPPSEINRAKTFGLTASVNSNINLMDFSQAIAALKAQRYADQAVYHRNLEEKNTIILLICRTYFDCMISQELSKVIDEKVDISKQIMELAARRVDLGSSDSIEYYQALINYEQDFSTMLSVSSLEEETLNDLKVLLGITGELNVGLDTSVFLLKEGAWINDSGFLPDSTSRVRALENDFKELQVKSKSTVWDMLPDLSVFTGYGYSNQTFQNGIVQQNTALGFSYGLTLSYGFGEIKNALHQNKIYKIQADNLSLQLRDEKSTVQNDYKALTQKSEQLKQTIESNQTVLKMAERTLKNSLLAYEMGSIALADLRLSQDQCLNAKIDLRQSLTDLFICQAELLALFNSLEEIILRTI